MIKHEMVNAYQHCQVDHTGIAIVLGFAAFFAVIAVIFELIELRKNK